MRVGKIQFAKSSSICDRELLRDRGRANHSYSPHPSAGVLSEQFRLGHSNKTKAPPSDISVRRLMTRTMAGGDRHLICRRGPSDSGHGRRRSLRRRCRILNVFNWDNWSVDAFDEKQRKRSWIDSPNSVCPVVDGHGRIPSLSGRIGGQPSGA